MGTNICPHNGNHFWDCNLCGTIFCILTFSKNIIHKLFNSWGPKNVPNKDKDFGYGNILWPHTLKHSYSIMQSSEGKYFRKSLSVVLLSLCY